MLEHFLQFCSLCETVKPALPGEFDNSIPKGRYAWSAEYPERGLYADQQEYRNPNDERTEEINIRACPTHGVRDLVGTLCRPLCRKWPETAWFDRVFDKARDKVR